MESLEQTSALEMRRVTLSSETKEFLVAHRMIQEAGDHVYGYMKKFWGEAKRPAIDGEKLWGGSGENYVDGEMKALWESIREAQANIIDLMLDIISEKMGDLNVTEI